MMTGAFAGRNVGEVFPVVSAVAKLVCEGGTSYAAYAHEALLDLNTLQVESLLSVHQSLRNQWNGIDDRARCKRDVNVRPALQMARFDEFKVLFFFDGTKCFYKLQRLTESEERTFSRVTLIDGSVPYEPMARLHSRHCPIPSIDTVEWKRCLGFAPDHDITKRFRRQHNWCRRWKPKKEIMRDHFQNDTFFLSIRPSVRGYSCWNLFCYRRTGLDVAYLMRRRSQSPITLPRMVANCGAPTLLKSDNAPEFKGKRWLDYLASISVRSAYTEAHHPNENLAERRGGT